MLKMRRHFSGGNKRFFLIALTVFLFAVVFAACGKENEPEDNLDNNTSTVSETSHFESNTDNSQINTTLPQYAFEEKEEMQNTEIGIAITTVIATKNEPEDNSDSNSATVSGTSPVENTTDNSQLNTTLPQYAFEEEEEEQSTENDTANTTVISDNGDYETENSTVAMPPKADSQQGEWGATVIN